MSAVLKPSVDALGTTVSPAMPAGIEVLGQHPGQDELPTPETLAFLAGLHRRFEARRQERLAARRARQAQFDAGALPGFRDDTRSIRESDWQVAPIPTALLDRRVEITGPVDPKMVINALNSGANCYMADFEDSTAPTWANLMIGQRALRDAVAGVLAFDAPSADGKPGKSYRLKPYAEQAVLLVRPRGWHLDEKHLRVDGQRMSASLFDLGLFAFHNAGLLAAEERGPYFYLPKLQCMEEALLWDEVLGEIEHTRGLAHGQMKVTVLIETLPAAFEMDEILYALRERIVGLNCGRWDYIFSYIKTLRAHRSIGGKSCVLPERGQVTMTQPFLKAYSELLIKTCHRRRAHAMGGMAAQIPNPRDPAANDAAIARVRADKQREVEAGHDGTWVAHPGLVPIARDIFDARMPQAHQQHVGRGDVNVSAEDLLKPSLGTISRAGFYGNVEVCVRYLAAWLDGNGCVPIHGMMEDAATAEISRAQLWQWLHFADDGRESLLLADGTPVDFALLERALIGLPSKLAADPSVAGASRIEDAIALLSELTHRDTLEEFLTLPAYEMID